MANLGEVFTTVETGWRRVDNTNNTIIGQMGWLQQNTTANTQYYVGGYMNYVYSSDGDDAIKHSYMSFNFTGKKLRVYGFCDNAKNNYGTALLEIDGKDYEVSYNYPSRKKSLLLFQTEDLEDTFHQCYLKGYEGGFNLDFIDVDENSITTPACGCWLINPLGGMTRYKFNNIHYVRSAEHTWKTSTVVTGGMFGTDNLGATLEFCFYGSKLFLLDSCYNTHSNDIEVWIDGKLDRKVCERNVTTTRNPMIFYQWFDKSNQKAFHTVKVVNGSSNSKTRFYFYGMDTDGVICSQENHALDMTPIQTSATSPATVTASNVYSNDYAGWKAFDGATPDFGSGGEWETALNATSNQWLTIVFADKTPINMFEICIKEAPTTVVPYHFQVFGCDDEINYIPISDIFEWDDWHGNTPYYFKLNGTFNFKCYKIIIYDSIITKDNTGTKAQYLYLSSIRYMLSQDATPFLFKTDNEYKTISKEDNSIITLDNGLNEFNVNLLDNKAIFSQYDVATRFSELPVNTKVVSKQNKKLSVEGKIGNNGVIMFSNDYYMVSAQTIRKLLSTYNIPENCSIKLIVSTNSGTVWNTYNGNEWSVVSGLNRGNILNSFDIINQNGIDITTINTVDFNKLNAKKVLLAFSISRNTDDKDVSLINVQWNYDEVNRLKQLDNSQVGIEIASNTLLVKPQENYDKIYINISTNI